LKYSGAPFGKAVEWLASGAAMRLGGGGWWVFKRPAVAMLEIRSIAKCESGAANTRFLEPGIQKVVDHLRGISEKVRRGLLAEASTVHFLVLEFCPSQKARRDVQNVCTNIQFKKTGREERGRPEGSG